MRRVSVGFLSLTIGLLAACGPQNTNPPPANPLVYQIDPAIQPKPDTFASKPLGTVQDAGGKVSVFATNEVWISPKDQAELNAFLARTGGTILSNNAVPDPPAGSGIQMDPKYKQATEYIVKLDASSLSLSNFAADAAKAGIGGKVNISSEAAAKLLALTTRERASGLVVGPNFLARSNGLVFSSQEISDGSGGFVDAFGLAEFGTGGSRASVTTAWQFVTANPPSRRVRLAIIDGGFWVDESGNPMSAGSAGGESSDLPAGVLQYDFLDNNYVASGRCMDSGGDCGWHGNDSASVSLGRINNRYGSAGTGGLVSDPILLRINFFTDQTAIAIRTAVAWGAEVISMSIGGSCDDLFCGEFGGLYPAMRNAWDNNRVMVASAGNGGSDQVGDVSSDQPCRGDHVICVGALNDGTNTAIGYSNFGPFVDIFAPTNIRAMPDGDSAGLNTATGTSASAPFVSGIVAMMRAYNASLNADQIRDILRSTAWTDSTDPKVTHYVNAYRAVRQVASGFAADALEANNTAGTASALGSIGSSASPTRRNDLTLHTTADRDHLRFTLSEYAQLSVDLEFMPALGNLSLNVIKESGALGGPEGVSSALRSDGQGYRYRATLVPPGTYRLVVAADNPNLYNLVVSKFDTPMSPDRFEANNTLVDATSLPIPGTGSYNLNLHNLTDSDFFFFNPSNTFPTSFRVNIPSRDMPITLRLFNNANTEVSNTICGTSCGISIPNGIHRLKVEGSSARGRYTLQALYQIDRSVLLPDLLIFPELPIFWIDPGDPAMPGWLLGLQDLMAFREVGKAKKAILSGSGLKISLLDKTGKVLAQGVPSTNPQLPGAEVALNGLTFNETYVLLVERLNPPSIIDGESDALGAIGYSLDLGN